MFCAFEAPQSRDGLPPSCAVFSKFRRETKDERREFLIQNAELFYILSTHHYLLFVFGGLQVLHRYISALLSLKVLERVATPIFVVVATTHDIYRLVNRIAH